MLNETDIVKNIFDPKIPALDYEILSEHGTFGCRRPVGAGVYDPSADQTIVCWHEGGMDIMVRRYDHRSGRWSKVKKVWANHMNGIWDYHNYPAMILAPDDRPLIFYCRHSSHMYQLTPMDTRRIDTDYTRKVICRDQTAYPHPVVCGSDIYIFYSRNQEISYPYRPLCYVKSTDCGETWSEPIVIVDSGKQDPGKFDEVYQCGGKFAPAQGGYPARILLSWTMWGGPKGHAAQGMGAYFAYLSLEDECLYSAGGKCLGKTIFYREMVEYCTVARTLPSETISHTISAAICESMPNGEPVVILGCKNPETGQPAVQSAIWREDGWYTETVEDRTWTVKDTVYDCEKEELRIACVLSRKLVIYAYQNNAWRIESVTDIPYANGADGVPYVNFITGYHRRYQLLLSTIDNQNMTKDYSGKWPVVLYGEKN